MGVFKKFIGGVALESIQFNDIHGRIDGTAQIIPCKDTNGTSRSGLSFATSYGWSEWSFQTASPYAILVPVATIDNLENYDFNDYQVNGIGTTTYTTSKVYQSTQAVKSYTITIANNNSSDITVSCIKFQKEVLTASVTNRNAILICAYYLDAPLTIPAGESRTITIELKVGTDVSVNET